MNNHDAPHVAPKYTCPMHPEIVSDLPGACPICGMDLVLQHDSGTGVQPTAQPAVKATSHATGTDKGLGPITWKSYMPLIVIIATILLVSIAVSIRDFGNGAFAAEKLISYFMIGFFVIFSMFKLLDLKGFAHGYRTYDLLAKRAPWYGYAYPFIELGFGISMILIPMSRSLLFAEAAVMLFSGLGVALKLAKKEPFLCACLGTVLKLPLTKVTLIEDFGMAALAIISILLI